MEEKLNICIISPNFEDGSQTDRLAYEKSLPGNLYFFKDDNDGIQSGLSSFLAQNHIHMVIAEFGINVYLAKEVCKKEGMPFIVLFDSNHSTDLFKDISWDEELSTAASAFVVDSKKSHQDLLDQGVPSHKIFFIPGFMSGSVSHANNEEVSFPHFVFSGRLIEENVPHLIILAFKDVLTYVPGAKLSMFGEGPLTKTCQQLIKALNLDEAVEIKSFDSFENFTHVMGSARAFVLHPSKENLEEARHVILQASAVGLPVITTRHEGLKDLVIEGETGFLVSEGDVTAMADAMIRLAQDVELAHAMGALTKEFISKTVVQRSIEEWRHVMEMVVYKKGKYAQQENPLVSVIIPVFNREKKVLQSIKSLQEQTYQNWEAIVVDDASEDGTLESVRKAACLDSRIHYVSHKTNKGSQGARNTGIKAAHGQWVAFLDSDDQLLPDSLEARLRLALKEKTSAVHSHSYIIEKDKPMRMYYAPSYKGWIYKDILKKDGPTFPSLMVKREALEHIGFLDEKIQAFQEWDTYIRLAKHYQFSFLPQATFIYDYTSEDSISRDSIRGAKGFRQIVRKHFWEMLRHGGVGTIGHHYSIVSHWYKHGGDEENSKRYRLKSLGWKVVSPYILLTKLKNMVTAQ